MYVVWLFRYLQFLTEKRNIFFHFGAIVHGLLKHQIVFFWIEILKAYTNICIILYHTAYTFYIDKLQYFSVNNSRIYCPLIKFEQNNNMMQRYEMPSWRYKDTIKLIKMRCKAKQVVGTKCWKLSNSVFIFVLFPKWHHYHRQMYIYLFEGNNTKLMVRL